MQAITDNNTIPPPLLLLLLAEELLSIYFWSLFLSSATAGAAVACIRNQRDSNFSWARTEEWVDNWIG